MDTTILPRYKGEMPNQYKIVTCCGKYTTKEKKLNREIYTTINNILYTTTLCGYSLITYSDINWIKLYYRSYNYIYGIYFQQQFFNIVLNMIKHSNEPIAKYNYIALMDLNEKIFQKPPIQVWTELKRKSPTHSNLEQ